MDSNDHNDTQCETTNFTSQLGNDGPHPTDFHGSWVESVRIGAVGGRDGIRYRHVYANNTASLTIHLPANTAHFRLIGTTGYHHGQYTVAINPGPLYPLSVNTFNASREWTNTDVLFYFNSLDPAVNYTVTVTGDEDPTKFLDLASYVVCRMDDP